MLLPKSTTRLVKNISNVRYVNKEQKPNPKNDAFGITVNYARVEKTTSCRTNLLPIKCVYIQTKLFMSKINKLFINNPYKLRVRDKYKEGDRVLQHNSIKGSVFIVVPTNQTRCHQRS